jgi:trans-2,3-dihydro-3-hydroxyanthranilate isomerase
MVHKLPIVMVDVFAERKLAGNQLAVVFDAADLTDEQMQAIALETNFSETTFVIEQHADRATVRIFTPVQELPFAGHPTIGTAWALTQGAGSIILDLPAGPVPVNFVDGIGWMTPPEVAFKTALSPEQAASLVGLSKEDLDLHYPVSCASVGPEFALIPLRNQAALKKVVINQQLHKQLLAEGFCVHSIFLFTADAYATDAHFATRMFFDTGVIREDPATGSANAAFAAYLRHHRGLLGDVVVDQGVEINRPSRLYLKVADTLQVGGKVQQVLQGELLL